LYQENVSYLIRPITSNEIEVVIKNLPPKKLTGSNRTGSKGLNSTRPLKSNTNVPTLLHKTERDVMLPNSFYEASITLVPKLSKNTSKQENCRPIFLMNMDTKLPSKRAVVMAQVVECLPSKHEARSSTH
jgi:hypothetical protein